MNILMSGFMASGKTTQAKLLAQKLGSNFFDSGSMLRENLDSDLGKEAKAYMDQGKYVPENIYLPLMEDYFNSKFDKSKGFVITGFPRTVAQIPFMEERLNIKLDKVFHLVVGIQEVIKRLENRQSEKRTDSSLESVQMRLSEDAKKAEPVLAYYKTLGIVEEVDGERSVEVILSDILTRLGKQTV